jgi:hypothetical protein
MNIGDCRIEIHRRTARWDPAAEVTAAEAMDFWAFAAGLRSDGSVVAVPAVRG